MARGRVGEKRRRSPSRGRSQSRRRPDAKQRHPIRRDWFAEEYEPIQIGSIDGTDTTPHDKGLVRALNACYDARKGPQIQGDPRVMKSWKPRPLGGGLGRTKKSGQLRFGGKDWPFKPPLGLR
ncbi:unnamed protein product [Peronospora destructor]|uniref:Uncharacterized protein n=1 Tax=Peronospora destructor TaxID=86335 RepID=A0AAV0TUH1_9STRA|nr:unnamed protein product [Peronospora destructor]